MKLIKISTNDDVTVLVKGNKRQCLSALKSYYKVFKANSANIRESYNKAMNQGMFELLYSDGRPMYKYFIVREK